MEKVQNEKACHMLGTALKHLKIHFDRVVQGNHLPLALADKYHSTVRGCVYLDGIQEG
jgi:hypothetical protein